VPWGWISEDLATPCLCLSAHPPPQGLGFATCKYSLLHEVPWTWRRYVLVASAQNMTWLWGWAELSMGAGRLGFFLFLPSLCSLARG